MKRSLNQIIVILYSLPETFKDDKLAIKYGRESLSLEDILRAFRSKELEIKFQKKTIAEGLQTKGRSEKKTQYKDKSNNKSKSRLKKSLLALS